MRVTALVSLNCESAATMLVLGADQIQIGPMAFDFVPECVREVGAHRLHRRETPVLQRRKRLSGRAYRRVPYSSDP